MAGEDAAHLSGTGLKEVFLGIASSIGMDTAQITQQVENALKSPLKLLPVRHHSPASANLVKQCIAAWEPKLVLIEGPCTADPLIQFITASDTVPPLAILSMFTDDQNVFQLNGVAPFSADPSIPAKFNVHYPFISYSPELVALVECHKKKIPVHFIDLPLTGIIPYIINFNDRFLHFLKQEEQAISTSHFYQRLVDIFHFKDFNEVWDTLFEIGIQDLKSEQARENMLVFCACVRQSIDAEALQLDGTLAREQFMKYTIEQHVAASNVDDSDVLVITGGMHSIALPATVGASIAFPTSGFLNTLVPFSYFRISEASGYGSGNQGPLYYERAWKYLDEGTEKPYDTAALDFITDILAAARVKEQVVSISDSISSLQDARLLASLRRRREPCLKDMIDAIYMSIVKGNPDVEGAYLRPLIRDLIVGHKIGRITKKIGRLPLQTDFYLRFESLGIELSEKPETFNLNLRDTTDAIRSILFWRVSYLGLDMLDRSSGPDPLKGVTGVFTETWQLHWTPSIDLKLIELNIFGSTIEEASRSKMLEELKKEIKNYERVSNLLYNSIVMGFFDDFKHLLESSFDSLDTDDNYFSLSNGFLNVVMIYQLLKVLANQELNVKDIETLLVRNYFSSCYALANYANPKDDMVDPLVAVLRRMATTLLSFTGVDLDRSVFAGSLKSCIDATSNEFIKGCCVGILHLMNDLSLDEVKRQVMEYARSEDAIKVKVGEFVRGIIYECQSQFLFNKDIIKLLDNLISILEWPVFAAILPSLKKSFASIQPREYDIFAEKLAEIYELKASIVKDLKDEVQETHRALFAEINAKVEAIFAEWFGDEMTDAK